MTTLPYQVAAPAARVVSKQDVKNHCNIDHGVDDTKIDAFIDAATSYLDGYEGLLGRVMVTQTWARKLSSFPTIIRLPIGPVASIESVTYYDADDVQQTLAPATYELQQDGKGAYATLAWQQSWPFYTPRPQGIEIQWIAGTAVASVPPALKQAIMVLIGHWYESREAVPVGVVPAGELPLTFSALIAPFRRMVPYCEDDYEEICSCH